MTLVCRAVDQGRIDLLQPGEQVEITEQNSTSGTTKCNNSPECMTSMQLAWCAHGPTALIY
jgi:hypothetical protein